MELQENINDFKKGIEVLKLHRKYLYVIAAIVTLAICSIIFQNCQHQKEKDELVKNISNYSDSAKHYKSKYGVIAYNQTLKFDNEKQLKSFFSQNDTLKELLKKFKKISSFVTSKQIIVIHDTVPIPYENIIPCDFKPFKVRRDTNWYHFVGTIHRDKFTIDSILVPNKQSIVVGQKKINMFKKEYRAEILNSNPYIQTTNVGSYAIDIKKKWYERPVVTFFIGIGIGSAATIAAKK